MKTLKGKAVFTKKEAEQIKSLIARKCKASDELKQEIAEEIRRQGFYYSDFSKSKHGYDVQDFNSLAKSGLIKILPN